jgi:hypothetical protein
MNNKRIDQYLRKSTRGLWGRKREEVREELSVHIEGRIHAYLIGGLNESDAVEKTLAELGHPTHVSAGMAKLHTLPVVAGSGMMLAMCCAVVVVLLSGSTAQTLSIINIFPADECIEATGTPPDYCKSGEWVSIEKLKEALEPQGVKFSTMHTDWVLTFPDNKIVTLDTSSQAWSFYWDERDPVTLNTRPDYITIRSFLNTLMSAGVKVRLEGWDKPIAYLGDKISLELALTNPSFGYNGFYAEPLANDLFNQMAFPTTYWTSASAQETATETKTFKVDDKENAVYGIALMMEPGKVPSITEDIEDMSVMFWDVGRVDANGNVQLDLSLSQPLTFKESYSKVKTIGDALFVRLTGEQEYPGYVVIPPDQIRLE